jgi:hypothetical protein
VNNVNRSPGVQSAHAGSRFTRSVEPVCCPESVAAARSAASTHLSTVLYSSMVAADGIVRSGRL